MEGALRTPLRFFSSLYCGDTAGVVIYQVIEARLAFWALKSALQIRLAPLGRDHECKERACEGSEKGRGPSPNPYHHSAMLRPLLQRDVDPWCPTACSADCAEVELWRCRCIRGPIGSLSLP